MTVNRLGLLLVLMLAIGHVPSSEAQNGDFNADGLYNCNDIDFLTADIAAGTNTGFFDLTGDGVVDLADQDAWLAEAGTANGFPSSLLPGDANLNGIVDIADFNVWNTHKFTNTPAWCSGDFNANGVVDIADFNVWNAHKFQSSDAVSTVPEPENALWLLWGLALMHKCLRRTRTGSI